MRNPNVTLKIFNTTKFHVSGKGKEPFSITFITFDRSLSFVSHTNIRKIRQKKNEGSLRIVWRNFTTDLRELSRIKRTQKT